MNFVASTRDVIHSAAEVCLNLWYFVDDSGVVLRLAGKAYALTGSDDQNLAALHLLSGADHLTATQASVPGHFRFVSEHGELTGAIPVSAIHQSHGDVFGPLINQIERELPRCIRSVADNLEQFVMKSPPDPLCVTTAVYERADGELVARLCKQS